MTCDSNKRYGTECPFEALWQPQTSSCFKTQAWGIKVCAGRCSEIGESRGTTYKFANFRRAFAKIRATHTTVYWLVANLGGSDKAKPSYVWAHRWSICFPYQPRFSHSRLHERSSLPPDFGLFRRYFANKRRSKFNVQRSVHRVIYVVNYPKRCKNIQFIYIRKFLYMFRVLSPPIISSSYHCIYSIWHYWDRYCYLSWTWLVTFTTGTVSCDMCQ